MKPGPDLLTWSFSNLSLAALSGPKSISGKVIATTLLRHGAILRNGEGRDFLADYGLTRENAQKGSLARAMLSEVRAGRGTPHGGIYYDLTMMDRDFLYNDHAIFTRAAADAGIDLCRDMPEMMPAAHTNLGGVVIVRIAPRMLPVFSPAARSQEVFMAQIASGAAPEPKLLFLDILPGTVPQLMASRLGSVQMEDAERAWAKAELSFHGISGSEPTFSASGLRRKLGECLHEYLGIQRSAESIAAAGLEVQRLRSELENARASSLEEAAEPHTSEAHAACRRHADKGFRAAHRESGGILPYRLSGHE